MTSDVKISGEMIIGGRYRVVREIATGGMGTVYEAENLRTRRRVAIKTIRPEVAERVSVVSRFEREAQAAGQLRHPNIVDVLDLGDDPEHHLLFIVQEFLIGGDLAGCLATVETISPRAALATLLPIMDALILAHGQGVVHRDLKPDNIFLHETPQGVIPKLIDFGIAKFTQLADGPRGSSSSLVGSPIYMSPEQVRTEGSIDARADVWSMGVVFYEALTAKTPFEGQSPYAVFANIAGHDPVPLATIAPGLPADLAAAIQRAVTKDRAARWQTMAEFAAALRACAVWRGVDAGRAARWIVNAQGVSAADDDEEEGPTITAEPSVKASGLWTGEISREPPPVASARSRWSWLAGAALVAAAATAGVIVTTGDRNEATVLRAAHSAAIVAPPAAAAPPAVVAPPVAVAVTPAAAPLGFVTGDAGAPMVVAVAAPEADAGEERAATRRATARRPRTVTASLPRVPIEVVQTLARGFNGAPIVE